jgi:hypothetical protein
MAPPRPVFFGESNKWHYPRPGFLGGSDNDTGHRTGHRSGPDGLTCELVLQRYYVFFTVLFRDMTSFRKTWKSPNVASWLEFDSTEW